MDENKSLTVPVAIVAAGLIIAGAIFFTRDTTSTKKLVKENEPTQVQPSDVTAPAPVTEADHVLGSPDAPITFIVYTDLECPFCRRFHESTLNPMMSDYGKTGKVKLVYRHFPLPASMHPSALDFALTSECVADIGGEDAFWEFTDGLFATDAASLTDALNVVQSLGVDKAAVNECVTSQKFLSKVKADQADGQRIGVRGTPSSYMVKDGEIIPVDGGAIPYEQIKPLIEAALKN